MPQNQDLNLASGLIDPELNLEAGLNPGTASQTGRLVLGQTTISPQRTIIERLIGAAPEAIGATAGGIIGVGAGTAVGTPIQGGAFGAATGAAGGKALEQIFRKLGIAPRMFGQPPEGLTEQLSELGTSAAFGGASEAGGQFIGPRLATAFKRKLTPDVANQIRIAEREGIPLSAGDVRPSAALQQLENLTRGTMFGGARIGEFERVQRQKLFDFRQRFLNKLGPLVEPDEAGRLLASTVKTRHQQLMGPQGIFARAYERASTIFPARVDTAQIRKAVAPIKKELDALTAEGRIGAAATSKESPSRFVGLVDRFSKYGLQETEKGTIEIPLTYKQVWEDKQALDGLIRSMSPDDPLRTRAKATLGRLHTILDNAMEESAQKVNPRGAQMIRNINRGYAKAKELFETESLVSDIGRMDESLIVDKFFKGAGTQPSKDLQLALAANPEVLPPLRRRVAQNLVDRISKELEQGTGIETTPGTTLNALLKINRPKLRTLFTQEQLNGFQEFADAAFRAQASGRMLNPMSGRQMLALQQASAMGTLLQAGAFGTSAGFGSLSGGAASLFAPPLIARALTNPTFAKLLAQGFELPAGSKAAAEWTARAMNILRIVAAQEQSEQQGGQIQ